MQQRQLANDNEQQTNYMLLLQQREEENRQEIAKLTAEIKSLKLQLLEERNKVEGKRLLGISGNRTNSYIILMMANF